MYSDLKNISQFYSLHIPKTYVPSPDSDDYLNGFITRYFVQKSNDKSGFVFELEKDIFIDLVKNPYWATTQMRWRISGPLDAVYDDSGKIYDMGVRASNKASILLASETIKNVGLYLPNILQFYK